MGSPFPPFRGVHPEFFATVPRLRVPRALTVFTGQLAQLTFCAEARAPTQQMDAVRPAATEALLSVFIGSPYFTLTSARNACAGHI
jgi:hypothetical protein